MSRSCDKARRFILLLLLSGLCTSLLAQVSSPFDLAPPSAKTTENKVELAEAAPAPVSKNPFDLSKPDAAAPSSSEASSGERPGPTSATQVVAPKEMSRGMEYGIVLFLLIFFALMMNFYRDEWLVSAKAMVMDGVFTQLYREREMTSNIPFRLYYIFFLINAGILVYRILPWFNLQPKYNAILSLIILILAFFLLFVTKRSFLHLIRNLFPGKKGINLYIFTIILFGTTLGPLLFLVNLLFPFTSPQIQQYLVIAAILPAFFLLILRLIRSTVIANQYFISRPFHFFLYICTVEIAPVLVFVKLIQIVLITSIGTF